MLFAINNCHFFIKKMDSIRIRFMLNILIVETLETRILPLPQNNDIFQLFPRRLEPMFVVDSNGRAMAAVGFITVVNENGIEIV